jgi:hypothetical protein
VWPVDLKVHLKEEGVMEVQGETEFLNKLLSSFADADQQKHGERLKTVETNHDIVSRAIHRMAWLCAAALVLLWGNSFLAGLVPPQLYLFGERVAMILLLGAAISYFSFVLYRFRIRRQLAYYRRYCRSVVAAALEWRSEAAVRLQRFAHEELYCAKCKTALIAVGSAERASASLLADAMEQSVNFRQKPFVERPVQSNS